MTIQQESLLESEDTQHGRYLTFLLGEEVFGIEIRYVTEIIGMHQITRLPELPEHIRGIINLRGKIIPVIDMRLRFKKEPIEYNDRTCIIVIDIDDISVGLIVDEVDEVITYEDDDIVPPPDCKTGVQNRFIEGIGRKEENVTLILDCRRLLAEEDADDKNVL
jgi:purine-binding chemotaxis protein CheW